MSEKKEKLLRRLAMERDAVRAELADCRTAAEVTEKVLIDRADEADTACRLAVRQRNNANRSVGRWRKLAWTAVVLLGVALLLATAFAFQVHGLREEVQRLTPSIPTSEPVMVELILPE